MAILFNPQVLSAFAKVNFGNNNAIANLGEGGNLVQKDKVGSIFLKPFRAPSTKDRNNAVRTELLKVLGQAFNIEGVTERDGKTRFSDQFMRRLEEILGPDAFKCGDFGIKDGAVDSGKPLTQRRITAIIKAACTKSESGYDANAYLVKVDAIADAFKGKNPDALPAITAPEGMSMPSPQSRPPKVCRCHEADDCLARKRVGRIRRGMPRRQQH